MQITIVSDFRKDISDELDEKVLRSFSEVHNLKKGKFLLLYVFVLG
jgi:hypothetical protein